MYYKVKILKSLPTAKVGKQVNGSLVNDAAPYGGGINKGTADPSINKTLQPVARDKANLEAEKNETVFTYDDSGIPLFYVVGGERHFKGGTPLNLPDDSFIFSDTKSMKMSDPQILKMFGKTDKKGSYTPAELSKVYDINIYRKILQDPNSDKIMIKTAEMMIKNYVIKLGALALAQESKKGFPQGIPKVAKPYMESQGISEEDLIPEGMGQEQGEMPEQPQQPMQQQQQAPSQMPNGEQVAMPEEMAQQQMPPEQMQQPMQRFGGARRLRRAQEGMQQQQQQGQQQGQGGDQMQQIMQQVTQALQQGAKPEEVVAQLLQGEIPPEEVAQIFVELGMPEDQVQQLVMGVMQQMQGGQEQQMDPGQQQQPLSEEEMMAMQQQDPQQMQQAPMAAYGMQMGGYGMPFSNSLYSYAKGGAPCDNGKQIYPDFQKFGCITNSQYNSLLEQSKANLEKQKVYKKTQLDDFNTLRKSRNDGDWDLAEKLLVEWKTKYPGQSSVCPKGDCPEYDLVLDPEPEIPKEIPKEIPELSLSGYPDAPIYNPSDYDMKIPTIGIGPGETKSKKHTKRLFNGKGQKYSWTSYSPTKDLDFGTREATRPIPKMIQKATGYDRNFMEGYEDEEGNYFPGEIEKAEEENRQINFKGIASLKDKKEQERYNKEWEQYNIEKTGIKDYNLSLLKEAGISPEEYVKKYGAFQYGGMQKFLEGGDPCPPCPDGTIPVRTETGDCPCPNNVEDLEFYKFALKERDYVMANPGMWEGDPDMTNEDGSYKFCVDCLVKDYNDPNVVKSVSALINNGIANFPKYDYPDLMKGLEKFNLPMPVYQSSIKKKRGGSAMNSMVEYGMQMGGYTMPDYMAYGGVPMYDGGGEGTGDRKVSKTEFGDAKYKDYIIDKNNERRKYINEEGKIEGGKNFNGTTAPGGGSNPNLVADICSSMKKKGSVYYGKSVDEVIAYALGHLNTPKYAAARPKIAAQLEACRQKGEMTLKDAIIYDEEPGTDCPECDPPQLDANGQKMMQQRDPITGECTPCPEYEDVCKCPNPNDPTKQVVVPCNEDGSDPDCELWEREQGQNQGGYEEIDNGYSDMSNLNVLANLGMRKPNLKRELVLPKEKVPWATGIDPRQQVHAGNAQFADINKGLGALSTDSGSYLTNSMMAQTNAITNANSAINAANQYNTGVSNDLSYRTTAALNKGIDERMPYIQNYLDQGNTIEGENVKFDNSKVAAVVGSLQAREQEKVLRNQMNANSETFGFDRNWNMRQTGDKKIKPVQTHTYEDYIRYYRDKVGLTDDKAIASAAKTAMDRQDAISKLGGQTFKQGGFIYSVFPNVL